VAAIHIAPALAKRLEPDCAAARVSSEPALKRSHKDAGGPLFNPPRWPSFRPALTGDAIRGPAVIRQKRGAAGALFSVRRRQRSDTLTNVRQYTGPPASDTVDTLVLDLLEWMGPSPRSYAEVLEACGRRVRASPCGKMPTIEASSHVIMRRDAARSSPCPPPGPSTYVLEGELEYEIEG
jgi:hypothetical protein